MRKLYFFFVTGKKLKWPLQNGIAHPPQSLCSVTSPLHPKWHVCVGGSMDRWGQGSITLEKQIFMINKHFIPSI